MGRKSKHLQILCTVQWAVEYNLHLMVFMSRCIPLPQTELNFDLSFRKMEVTVEGTLSTVDKDPTSATTNVPSINGSQGIVIGVVVLLCTCAIGTLLFLCGCARTYDDNCCTSNSQRRNSTTGTNRNRDTSTITEQQLFNSEDTALREVPPPNYSKVGLYPTDENYDKEHHTYIRPVDSDDVFDNKSEPPAYESRVRMSIGDIEVNLGETSRQSQSVDDSDEHPIQMRQVDPHERQIITSESISTTV